MGILDDVRRRLANRSARRGAARAQREQEEQEFVAATLQLVRTRAEALERDGLARIDRVDRGDGMPADLSIEPTSPGAASVCICFDYPTFFVSLPRAGGVEPLEATAELFGTFAERLVEIEQRLDAIIGGRLAWSYAPDPSCVVITWSRADGTPFLETHYSGASQGPTPASGRAAPYA